MDSELLRHGKEKLLLVNTARGELFDEAAVVAFLKANPGARAAVDVLTDETREKDSSRLRAFSTISDQVLITPHIGGMTIEGQNIAFSAASEKLRAFLMSRS